MSRHLTTCVAIVGLILVGATAMAAEATLTITTLPFDSPKEQKAVFGILSRHLGKLLGRPVRFEVGKSYADVIERLSSGKADVGFLGAIAYVKARRQGEVRAILRAIRHRKSSYYGIVVVRRGSSIKTLEELKGKRFAFVDESSGGGYVFPRLLLEAAGINPEKDMTVSFAGGHHTVVRQVAAGDVDAGACFEGAQELLADPESVVPIARTEPIPGDPVVVRPGLGVDTIRQLRSALIELPTIKAAKPFFTYSEIDGFVPAVDSDYDRIAEILKQMK